MDKVIQNFAEIISQIIYLTDNTPLDGDETERLGKLLTIELDIRQGNITEEEYRQKIKNLV